MAFDGIITKQVVFELNPILIGGKINKIFEPNKNELILGIYSHGKNYNLCVSISSNNYSMHITNNVKPNPISAPNFCMLLRKHLTGFKITNIYSNSLERIIYIDLEGFNELNDLVHKKLIIELMGKHSNIILVNDNNMIIDSMRHLDTFSGSTRDILPAHEYITPPNDKEDFYQTNLNDFTKNNSILQDICQKYNGISKAFISHTLKILNINDTNFTNKDTEKLYDYIKDLLNNLGTNNISIIPINNNSDYTLEINTNNNKENELNINLFLDDFYKKKDDQELLTNYKNNLSKLVLKELKKITKKVDNINSKLKECENIDTYRIYGELITSNLYKIDDSKNIESITLENYYDNNNLISIPLDTTICPSYNAKKYFKKYHKLKNTLEIVNEQKKEALKELEYLESIIYELEDSETLIDLEQIDNEIKENILPKPQINDSKVRKIKTNKKDIHNEYEPIKYDIDGFTFFIGKNNKQNDYITTKLGKNEDIWFHTKDIRGSHCLLKCNGNEVNQSTIITCAQLAAFYSKAKLSSNVPIDYCFIKNVKKPSNSKPGMVIYTNNKTINVNPLDIKK